MTLGIIMSRATSLSHCRQRQHGFTLIEVMIVVAIVGILAAVAYPSYAEFIRRGHRAEARAGLLQAAQWMERAATARGTYPLTAQFPTNLTKVPGGRYDIAAVSNGTTFTLSATPKAGTPQVGDKCGIYTLDNTGARTANGKKPTDSGYDDTCWGK
jgi:type IV pilus assembly protein PilE